VIAILDEIVETLDSDGFNLAPRPKAEGLPDLPADPTLLSDGDVATLFFAFTGWLSYAETKLWEAAVEERFLELGLSRLKARNLSAGEPGKGSVTAQKALAALDPEVMRQEEHLMTAVHMRMALDNIYKRCDRNAAAMSREMSRRGARASTDRRSSKWGA
jgi:hypothetical protein